MRLSPYAKSQVDSRSAALAIGIAALVCIAIALTSEGEVQLPASWVRLGHTLVPWYWGTVLAVFVAGMLFRWVKYKARPNMLWASGWIVATALMSLSAALPEQSSYANRCHGIGTLLLVVLILAPYIDLRRRPVPLSVPTIELT